MSLFLSDMTNICVVDAGNVGEQEAYDLYISVMCNYIRQKVIIRKILVRCYVLRNAHK